MKEEIALIRGVSSQMKMLPKANRYLKW